MEKVVGGKYRIGRKIGSGSFGEIYIGMIYKKLSFCMFELFYFLKFLFNVWVVLWSFSGAHVVTSELVAIKKVSLIEIVALIFGYC